MAVQRLTLAQITTEILRITGYTASSLAPWSSDANLYVVINRYGQRLPLRCAQVAISTLGLSQGTIRFDMHRTVVNSATTGTGLRIAASSSTAYLPTDFDAAISWWDRTNNRRIRPIVGVAKWHDEVKTKPAGPPEAIEILGVVLDSSDWRRQATLHPATVSGVTPSVELTYYRLPAIMPGSAPSSEYPDTDIKYQDLWIYGPVLELMRPGDPAYDRYAALEKELLVDLAQTAKAV